MSFDFGIFLTTLFMLLAAHALADFPLQGDFLSKAKNPDAVHTSWHRWVPCMSAHCLIHAGAVFLICGSLFFALVQFASHFYIDYCKCTGRLQRDPNKAFLKDQLLHGAVLVVLAFLYGWG